MEITSENQGKFEKIRKFFFYTHKVLYEKHFSQTLEICIENQRKFEEVRDFSLALEFLFSIHTVLCMKNNLAGHWRKLVKLIESSPALEFFMQNS